MSIIITKDGNGKHIIDLNGTIFEILGMEDHLGIYDIFNPEFFSEVNNGYFDYTKVTETKVIE